MGLDKAQNPIIILCRLDGRVLFINQRYIRENTSLDTLRDIFEFSKSLQCDDLPGKLRRFIESDDDTLQCEINCKLGSFTGIFYKLNNLDSEFAEGRGGDVLIELVSRDAGIEQNYLMRAGRMTSKLIHDFKNQMGGLKLYTTFLKKRFADNPEALEITEKILQSVDNMANHSAAVSKLTRPMVINKTPVTHTEIFKLITSIIGELNTQAKSRSVKVDAVIDSASTETALTLGLDKVLMQSVWRSIISRAIDVSKQDDDVNIKMLVRPDEIVIDISDYGQPIKNSSQVFDYFSGEPMTRMSLDLALARRIIEEHDFKLESKSIAIDPRGGQNIIRVVLS